MITTLSFFSTNSLQRLGHGTLIDFSGKEIIRKSIYSRLLLHPLLDQCGKLHSVQLS